MLTMLHNPIDQFLVLGFSGSFTNYILAIAIIMITLCSAFYFLVYSTNLNKVGSLSSSLRNIASDAISSTQGYTSYLIFLFLVILSSNMLGMITYTLTVTS